MSEPDALPEEWEIDQLADVATTQLGKTINPREKNNRPQRLYLRNANVQWDTFRLEDVASMYFSDSEADQFRLISGDLLVCEGGEVGRAAIWRGQIDDCYFQNALHRIRPRTGHVTAEWLLQNFRYLVATGEIGKRARGNTILHLSQSAIRELPIVIPPRQQQGKILEIINSVDTRATNVAGHLHAARRAITTFRQSVLAAAYEEALAGSDGGAGTPLADLLAKPMRNGYSARPVHHETPFRILTLTATTSGWFDGRHYKYTDETFDRDSPFWVQPGDILIQRGNTAEYVGVPALYNGEPNQFLYPDLMIRIQVQAHLQARFVWYMLLAPQARNFVRSRATGSAGNMPKINQAILSAVSIPVPKLEDRRFIVEKLDRALAAADRIEAAIDSAGHQIALSSQAILAKAFRGELTCDSDPSDANVGKLEERAPSNEPVGIELDKR